MSEPSPFIADWPSGGGELGQLIRALNWDTTPVGPPARWPGPLRDAARSILGNVQPACVLWGNDWQLIYNDAYRAIAGKYHPEALGRPAREVWPAAWQAFLPVFASAMSYASSISMDHQPHRILRQDRYDQAFFSLHCQVIRQDDGALGGVLVRVRETSGPARIDHSRQTAPGTPSPTEPRQAGGLQRGRRGLARRDPHVTPGGMPPALAERRRELEATERRHRLNALLLEDAHEDRVLAEIVEAAMAITAADACSVQLDAPLSGRPRLAAQRGLPSWWGQFWQGYSAATGTGEDIFDGRQQRIVADVTLGPMFSDKTLLHAQLAAGLRALQSTPMLTRSGLRVGVLSTYHRAPVNPSAGALRLLERLAGKAADVLDHTWTRAALSASKREQQREEREHRLLADVGAALASLDGVGGLQTVARLTVRCLGQDCWVLLAGGAGRVQVAATYPRSLERSADPTGAPPAVSPPGDHPVSMALRERRTVVVEIEPGAPDPVTASTGRWRVAGAPERGTALVAPLVLGDGGCLGALSVAFAPGHGGEDDRRLVEEVARRCAIFVENSLLYEVQRRAVRARDDLMAIVAHDLRGPLQAILGQLELLQRADGGPERRSQRALKAIADTTVRMQRLVDDLTVARLLQEGPLLIAPETLSPEELLDDVLDAERARVLAANLYLHVDLQDDLPDVWADRERVRQVFDNLMDNALRFTLEGGISLGARPSPREVVFWVADTGPGIPAQQLGQVFEPFGAAGRQQRSSGVGLAVVKGLIECQRGCVWVESMVGQGTTFFFTLPVAPEPPAATNPPG